MNVVQLFAFGTFVIDLIVAEMNLLSNVSTIFSRYVELCMKYVELLLASGVRFIMVFDGFSLDAKCEVESVRKR